ncbi:hypothetical protein F6W69_06335 [Microbacterium oxydans]|nr:hypothetical protein F6W69_06335 [Microbacterium oxydans]GED38140.1 hypothetical protein MOX01_12820 [Microbacterium oxydans]
MSLQNRSVAALQISAAVARPSNQSPISSSMRCSGAGVTDASSGSARRVDVLTYRPGVRSTDPSRVTGAKPAVFCRWVFDLLGAEPQDEFSALSAGSGGVMRAWAAFSGRDAGVRAY